MPFSAGARHNPRGVRRMETDAGAGFVMHATQTEADEPTR